MTEQDKQGAERKVVAWVRFRSDGGIEGPIMDFDSRMCDVRRKSGAWTPLYTDQQPSAPQAAGTPADHLAAILSEIEAALPSYDPGKPAHFPSLPQRVRALLSRTAPSADALPEQMSVDLENAVCEAIEFVGAEHYPCG